MQKINKKTDFAFNKKIYLLGQDKDGYNVYLEAPSWNCNWYWGFGYVERYTNKTNPSKAKDILSHAHWDGYITGKYEIYDFNKEVWINNDYIYHINMHPDFVSTVLTDKEAWQLSDLMQSYYVLEKAAAFFHRGNSCISSPSNTNELKNKDMENKINKELLPIVFEEIDNLLSPKNN